MKAIYLSGLMFISYFRSDLTFNNSPLPVIKITCALCERHNVFLC